MIDYDKYLDKTYGPEPDETEEEEETEVEDDLYYCEDPWCDGHSLPSGRCLDRDEEQ